MKLVVADLFLVGILSAAIHWLIARSYVFEWFWGRTRGFLEKLLACAACSGFWIGIALGLGGIRPIIGVDWWAQVAGAGFLALYLTPVFEGVLVWGLNASALGSFSPQESPPVVPQSPLPDEHLSGVVPQRGTDEEL